MSTESVLASREIFWNIPLHNIIYILAVIALAILGYSIYRRYRLWRLGKEETRVQNVGKRIWLFVRAAFTDGLGHKRFLREPYPGIMHLLLFWGSLIFLIASTVDFVTFYINRHIVGNAYLWFSLIVDIGGILILIGIIMAAYRRYILKPERLKTIFDDGFIMILTVVIVVTGYVVEGLRIANTELASHPDWAVWSPGGYIFARAFAGMSHDSVIFWHRFFWWLHSGLVIGGIIYFAVFFSKFLHIFVSPWNIFLRNLGPVATPAAIDIENVETLGAGNIRDFTWKQLLDLDACTNCGRCQDACPAWASGKPLSPRKVIQDLKVHMLEAGKKPAANPAESAPTLVGEGPTEDEIWACTTCAACQEACPVYVEHILKIIDMRRNLVLAQSKMPETAQLMLRNMQMRGHPWTGVQSLRLRGDWTSGLDLKILSQDSNIDTLFWVGCTGALVERNVEATLSMVRVLNAAGVNFGVLGEAEACCGDPARRAGYEFQFQIMAEQNIEVFKSYNIKEIVTSCPHCYNILKNDYRQFGGDFKVTHYTQLIADLIKQSRLKLSHELDSTFTYHDPCYLGRYNGEYSASRQVLQAIPQAKLLEMERVKSKSFCCGGGGGHMWIEEQLGRKINEIRTEDALKTGAETVVTACPYCLQMMEEGIERKEVKESLKAKDLIELVEEAMEKPD